MGKVIWTEPALADLREIRDFVAKGSPAYAARLASRLVDAPRRLVQFSKSGHRIPEFEEDHIRELLVGSYRLIYVLRNDTSYIVAVVHGSRDLEELLKREDLEGG